MCACEDFTDSENVLYEFENLALSTNPDKKIETELKNIAISSYACLKENGKKINYMTYIKSNKNADCINAIKRVIPKIDIEQIESFIDEIDCMSNDRKEFYKKVINYRYEIVKSCYDKLL